MRLSVWLRALSIWLLAAVPTAAFGNPCHTGGIVRVEPRTEVGDDWQGEVGITALAGAIRDRTAVGNWTGTELNLGLERRGWIRVGGALPAYLLDLRGRPVVTGLGDARVFAQRDWPVLAGGPGLLAIHTSLTAELPTGDRTRRLGMGTAMLVPAVEVFARGERWTARLRGSRVQGLAASEGDAEPPPVRDGALAHRDHAEHPTGHDHDAAQVAVLPHTMAEWSTLAAAGTRLGRWQWEVGGLASFPDGKTAPARWDATFRSALVLGNWLVSADALLPLRDATGQSRFGIGLHRLL